MSTRGALIHTRRWNDPALPSDGTRLLVCRYRPRGLRSGDETWDEWWKQVAPSRELHADYWGKHGPPIDWAHYRRRYLAEMRAQEAWIGALATRAARGEVLTLLCSSACVDEDHCHRTLLKQLIEEQMRAASPPHPEV